MQIIVTFSIVLLFNLAACLSGAAETVAKPNIVLVMSDDHGYGDCGYTGHPFVKTPNIDAMAENGVVFNKFHASAPVCSPTRASLLTGRHPFRTNVPNHGHYMRPEEVTIAEVLSQNGYVTGHFGKWHIGSVQAESPTSPGGAGFDEWISGLNFFDIDPYLSRNGVFEHIEGQGSVIVTDEAIRFIKRHHSGDKPMFVVLWLPAPHYPLDEIPTDMEGAATLYDEKGGEMAGYFREITLLDQQVGRVRDSLRQLGINDNTLFMYCSDNGGLVDESAGGREKKGSIYQGGLRVPAVIEWPGKLSPLAVDTPAVSSDLFPTFAAVAGAKVKKDLLLDGVDISPLLTGKAIKRPPMGFWHNHTEGQSTYSDRTIKKLMEAQQAGEPNPFPERVLKNVNEYPEFGADALRGHAAWTAWPWKLHRIQSKADEPTIELYNLDTDPMEENDLSAKYAKRSKKMLAELEKWQNSVLKSWSGKE